MSGFLNVFWVNAVAVAVLMAVSQQAAIRLRGIRGAYQRLLPAAS